MLIFIANITFFKPLFFHFKHHLLKFWDINGKHITQWKLLGWKSINFLQLYIRIFTLWILGPFFFLFLVWFGCHNTWISLFWKFCLIFKVFVKLKEFCIKNVSLNLCFVRLVVWLIRHGLNHTLNGINNMLSFDVAESKDIHRSFWNDALLEVW